jgi:hypothetical protein
MATTPQRSAIAFLPLPFPAPAPAEKTLYLYALLIKKQTEDQFMVHRGGDTRARPSPAQTR